MANVITKRVVFAGILLILLGVSACGGDDSTPPPPDLTADLRIPLRIEPTISDPQKAGVTTDLGVLRSLFRGLLSYDEKLNLAPMAAKEVPTERNGGISKDGLVYTLKLRDGLKWSDGEPLTASAFEYATKRLLDPTTRAPRASAAFDITGAEKFNACKDCSATELAKLRDEVGVKAVDDSTLVFTLKARHSTFPYLLTHPTMSPVRQDIIEKYADKWTDPANFVSNGPFVIKERVPKDRLVLVPNPYWWGTQPKVQSVTFVIIPDNTDGFNAFIADKVDLVEVPPEQTRVVDGDPKYRAQNVKQPLLQTLAFFFNTKMPPFDNPGVRQAFALALNRDAFVAEVLQGVGRPTYSWLPPAAPGYSKELGLQWKFNGDKARTTLAAAGYPDGKDLPKVIFPYRTSGLDKTYAEFFQAQIMTNLHVSVELQPMESRAWTDAFQRKEHMIVFVPFTFAADAESSLVDVFGCKRSEGDKCVELPGNNISQYTNLEVDRIMQQAAKEPNADRRVGYYSKAEKIIVDDSPLAFMFNPQRNLLVKPNVHGLKPTPLDSLIPSEFSLERVYKSAN